MKRAARALGDGPWDVVYRDAPLEEVLLRVDRLRRQAEGRAELEEMRCSILLNLFMAVSRSMLAIFTSLSFSE